MVEAFFVNCVINKKKPIEYKKIRKASVSFFFLKGVIDAFLKIIILCIWCNRIC